MSRALNKIRYRIAWLRWFMFEDPISQPGDGWKAWGKSREERNRNIRLMRERHDAREPQPQDFEL